ncbi:MAG: arginine--tRNA ligase [Sulfobacillus sp.]
MAVYSRMGEARDYIARTLDESLRRRGFENLGVYIEVDRPTEEGHGDLTSNVALKVARFTKMAPKILAGELASRWPQDDIVESVEAKGAGFLNFTLKTRWLAEVVNQVRADPAGYGASDAGQGARVLIEFVSANPVGPMVIVNGRAAAVGDSMARIMNKAGFLAHREFYVNDGGNQVLKLGQAIWLRLLEMTGTDVTTNWPEDVYPGAYVKDVAAAWRRDHPDVPLDQLGEHSWELLGDYGARVFQKQHEKVLRQFGVEFDRWFHEKELRQAHAPEAIVERLDRLGYIATEDGARWFLSERFGDDKNRVMVKSDGTMTYFVPDAAYHADKFDRGYQYVIDLLGPDHHGYVGRMRAVVQALGYPPDRLEILIIGLVRLLRGTELVRMSKRKGSFVLLEDLIEEAGVDQARYFFLERAPETPMDFDLDLAQLRDSKNPVYYIQYAGARIHGILRQWRDSEQQAAPLNLDVLTSPLERILMILLSRFPDVIARSAMDRAPQYLPRYLTELAGAFHGFYREHRILDEEAPLRQARLALIEAVLAVLATGLGLLGISLPQRM